MPGELEITYGPRHSALEGLCTILSFRRPIGKTVVVLTGSTGVGKSSIVNHLLNADIETSDSQSMTR